LAITWRDIFPPGTWATYSD